MKVRELDLLIVVNMFLTGFDSETVNTPLGGQEPEDVTAWCRRTARTNRILNSLKPSGNIVCFRDLEQANGDAFTLFGDTENSTASPPSISPSPDPDKEAYAAYVYRAAL